MTVVAVELGALDADASADVEIAQCLDPRSPRSFFLYAGAGSGKTRSLKNALDGFRDRHGEAFRRTGQRVAVITYTNAAADEIAERVGRDPLFPISTIHSFCWTQICSHRADIQRWLVGYLSSKLVDVREKQSKGRAGTKAAQDRERSVVELTRRLKWLGKARRFTYNPNGDNFGADSLSHHEVLSLAAFFMASKPAMQAVMVNRFPFILIDESQDTSKVLMDAFFALARATVGRFAVGLFGDTMQRIYADGHPALESSVPSDWARPAKRMNHRSPRRVVRLGNSLRAAVDGQRQLAREDSAEGVVRLFVVPAGTADKAEAERRARVRMAELCGDPSWTDAGTAVKTLTLEHRMAATRRGFVAMFDALDQDSRLSTGLKQGDLAGLRLFTERVAPLLAESRGNSFAVMDQLRRHSPLMHPEALAACADSGTPLMAVREAFKAVAALDVENPSLTFLDVLRCVAKHGLFQVPPSLQPFVEPEEAATPGSVDDDDHDDDGEASSLSMQVWREFLSTPFRQIVPYAEYITDRGPYGTHQGVKGLEFDRVLVILDDEDAKGFLFSYEKLFGVEALSDGDRERAGTGVETGVDRTRRLLYVTCTRAKRSLALVAYTKNPARLTAAAVKQGWFEASEVEQL
ncbi:MAG: ATP-dependent helicase [Labilithrix sp.]|nr:ATP-dependent helicase [Labilithrix sp.]MBX3216626.1 ATP-dependent helicase [Labilithrix sp.]